MSQPLFHSWLLPTSLQDNAQLEEEPKMLYSSKFSILKHSNLNLNLINYMVFTVNSQSSALQFINGHKIGPNQYIYIYIYKMEAQKCL